jgi:alkylhydroperoxidase family enzyme
MTFQIFHPDTAPPESRGLLENMRGPSLGLIPELPGIFAGAPALLEAYAGMKAALDKTSLSIMEKEVVLRAAAHELGCIHCITVQDGHDIDEEIIAATEEGKPLPDTRLEALRDYAVGVIRNEGRPSENAKIQFLRNGYGPRHALEIVLCVGIVAIAAYTASLAHSALEKRYTH